MARMAQVIESMFKISGFERRLRSEGREILDGVVWVAHVGVSLRPADSTMQKPISSKWIAKVSGSSPM